MFEVKKKFKSQLIDKTINRTEWKFWNESTIFEMKNFFGQV